MINSIIRTVDNWEITIMDNGEEGRNHKNPNKLNFSKNSRICRIIGCDNQFRINRTSGLCDNHIPHQSDLYLEMQNPGGDIINAPSHKDIIDALIEWSSTRNFGLLPFFSRLSFNVLGNIPDVTTLNGEVIHEGIDLPSIDEIFDDLIEVTDMYFPINNNSSYQSLRTPRGEIPAIVLAYTFVGLLICEEANRGDRWFNRIVRKDESKTTQLGAAMPIAYFATRIFPWGVEMNNSARNLTR